MVERSLFCVYFESAHYAGYGEHYVVFASNEDEARELTESLADEYFCDQDQDQLDSEGIDPDGLYSSHIRTEEVTKDWDYLDILLSDNCGNSYNLVGCDLAQLRKYFNEAK